MGHYFGWVGVNRVDGALFWVGEGGWENIMSGEWVRVSGGGSTI